MCINQYGCIVDSGLFRSNKDCMCINQYGSIVDSGLFRSNKDCMCNNLVWFGRRRLS